MPEDILIEDELQQPAPETWFPYTKLRAPQPGDNNIARARLQEPVARAIRGHKLTLIAAPAGSGKTMLCASLAQGGLSTSWVALDEADNDLPLFAALLVSALRPQLQEEGHAVLTFLQTVPDLAEKTAQLATRFINSLRPIERPPHVLILDDYHVISDPAVHQLVTYLLEYLPDSLRLLIATRHDPPLPLPRLRARGQLAEFRLSELRFDEEETAMFLNQGHQLALTTGEIDVLQQRTDGWAAGLQLLAAVLAAIEDSGERARYIQHLSPASRSIFDLLAAEVLAHQPANIQEFLLQTAVLTELTPANCQAVTNNPDAPRLLMNVYRRNLFLRALAPDAQDGPFRYHDLFHEFLQQRLRQEQPGQWLELHRRAAQTAASDEQKLHHLSSAELWEEAAPLLERMGQIDAERRFTRRSVVAGIERLPEAVRLAHPWLLLYAGQYYAIRGQIETAAPWLSQAAERFREMGDEVGEIEILAARAMTDAMDTDEIVITYRQKVAKAGHLLRPDQWSVYHGAEQWHAIAVLDWPTLSSHLQDNISLALKSGDPGALTMTGLTIGPQMLFSDGMMARVEEFASRSRQIAGRDDWILHICQGELLGAIRFFQGRLDEADAEAREAHRLLQEIGGLAWVDDHVSWLILALSLARGAYHSFDEFFGRQQDRWVSQDTSHSYRQSFMYLQARSFWLRNRVGEAQRILSEMQASSAPSGYDIEDEVRRLLLGSLIAISRGNTGDAKRDLQRTIELHDRVRHTVMLTHPRLTLATLYGRQNRWVEALSEFRLVLAELKVRGMPGVILQEGESIVPLLRHAIDQGIEREMLQPLLAILQPDKTPRAVPLPGSDEHLTPRESEVLRLLATGATNPAIAAELSITERTVKAHVSRILAKLDAATRTEAVQKAIHAGLL